MKGGRLGSDGSALSVAAVARDGPARHAGCSGADRALDDRHRPVYFDCFHVDWVDLCFSCLPFKIFRVGVWDLGNVDYSMLDRWRMATAVLRTMSLQT